MGFKPEREYFADPPIFVTKTPTRSHYAYIFEHRAMKSILNSLSITIASTALVVMVGSLAAYSIVRLMPKWGKTYAVWILSMRLFPPIAVVLPIFLMMKTLHLVDTYLCLILVYAMFNLPLVIWILKGFFEDIPLEIAESATMDGCSHLQIYWHIILPLSMPGLVATTVLAVIFSWNEFLFALILTRSATQTLTVHLSSFKSSTQ